MEKAENYVELEFHNKIMETLREKELQYKNRIIELEKQKQYEINRANQFQIKFKQALLLTGAGNQKDLIEKLSLKQNQNNDLRVQILKLKRNIDILDQHQSGKSLPNNNEIKHLFNQNQQMAKTIEQLKDAAISAIMAKDDEIEQLNQKLTKSQQLTILYQKLLERQESLQLQIQKIRQQAEQQQKVLSDKLTKERQKYIQKLQQFHKNLQHEQLSKQQLLEKAQTLQTNLESKQQVIELYQRKINELQHIFRQENSNYQQQKQKLLIQIDNLKDRNLLVEKQIHHYQKVVSQLKFKEKQHKIISQRLREQNSQLQRKLTIKKRKNNTKLKSSDIYSSFEGISQKSSFYSSFYKPNQSKPTDLTEIIEMEETDILQNFIDLEERMQQKLQQVKQIPKTTKKKQKTFQAEINSTIPIPISNQQKITVPIISQKQIINQSIVREDNIEQQKSQKYQKLYTEFNKIKIQLQQSQQQIKALKEKNQSFKKNIQSSYQQIELLTKQISSKTSQIQRQRQTLADLRSQNKRSQNQKQLMVEHQNLKQHVFKLQNALLIQKLQNAEKQEFVKQRNQRQRKNHEQKVNRLNQEIKNLSPKKKKGFFR